MSNSDEVKTARQKSFVRVKIRQSEKVSNGQNSAKRKFHKLRKSQQVQRRKIRQVAVSCLRGNVHSESAGRGPVTVSRHRTQRAANKRSMSDQFSKSSRLKTAQPGRPGADSAVSPPPNCDNTTDTTAALWDGFVPVRVLTAWEKELNKDSEENVRLRTLKRKRIEEEIRQFEGNQICPEIKIKLLESGDDRRRRNPENNKAMKMKGEDEGEGNDDENTDVNDDESHTNENDDDEEDFDDNQKENINAKDLK